MLRGGGANSIKVILKWGTLSFSHAEEGCKDFLPLKKGVGTKSFTLS